MPDLCIMGEAVTWVTLWSNHHRQTILEKIWNCFVDQYKVDVDITCHGHTIGAHRFLLELFCPALVEPFEAVTSGDKTIVGGEGGKNGRVTLNLDHLVTNQRDVDFLLEFVYRGKTTLPQDRLSPIGEIAKTLGLRGLVDAIEKLEVDREVVTNINGRMAMNESMNTHSSRRKRRKTPVTNTQLAYEDVSNVSSRKKLSTFTGKRRDVKCNSRLVQKKVRLNSDYLLSDSTNDGATDVAGPSSDSEYKDDCLVKDKDNDKNEEEGGNGEEIRGREMIESTLRRPEKRPKLRQQKTAVVLVGGSVRLSPSHTECRTSRSEYKKLWRRRRPPQKCPQCDYETRDKDSYKSHMAKHDPAAERFVCDVCSKKFRSKRGFTCHKRGHLGPDQLHKCFLCEFHTPQKSSWVQHLAVIHKVDRQGNRLLEKFKCPDCDFVCVADHKLKVHVMRKHSTDKPFKCSECDYATFLKYDLDKHVAIRHRNERPYMCEVCGFRSQTQSGYERHKRSHTGEKPYKCHVCGQMYADGRKLKIHLQRHVTDEKPFVCHVCGHACRRKDNLQMHFKRIHKTTLDGQTTTEILPEEALQNEDETDRQRSTQYSADPFCELYEKPVIQDVTYVLQSPVTYPISFIEFHIKNGVASLTRNQAVGLTDLFTE